MCFQRKSNGWVVRLGAKGNNLLNNYNLVRKEGNYV